MIYWLHASRRGVALLLVLAVVVSVVPVIALAASRANAAVQLDNSRFEAAMADDLMQATSMPIADWLRRDAPQIALPPTASQPMVPVLDDVFELSGTPIDIVVTAWDLQGMLPADVVRSGSPLRLTLSEDVRQRLDDLNEHPDGLDCIAPRRGERLVFPSSIAREPSLGALISTANRPAAQPTVRLNVNTTPAPLLAQALRLAGRGGYDQIMERRAEGKRGGPPPVTADGRTSRRIVLTASSSNWGIRIDVRVGSVRRSWWTVWTRVSGDWMLRRRVSILWEPHPEAAP
ncbi:MAG: hypothetical protein HRU13_03780 [Phycisphaerales bacterium]|nr:hypothetical protein [Phycisphaerales bacterium]